MAKEKRNYVSEEGDHPEEMRKIIDFEASQLPKSPSEYKIGSECEVTFIVKVIGEKKDLGEPHIITFKVVKSGTYRKKYKHNWIF